MLQFFDTFFKTWEIADDIIDAIKDARQPNSDGGLVVTSDELYEIGMHFMEKIAEVAGTKLEIKDKK